MNLTTKRINLHRILFSSAALASVLGGTILISNNQAQAQFFGTNLTVEYGVDRPGHDYKGSAVTSLGQCVELCAKDSNCQSYTYVKKYQQPPHKDNQSALCHLKKAKSGQVRDSGMISGHKY